MVVEDEVEIRSIVCDVLEDEGYNVSGASNGAEALALLDKRKPDLILLDLQMPVMSGWTFLKEMQKTDTFVPVIIVSAKMKSVEEARKLGAVDCLNKPFDLTDLIDIVSQYTGSAQPTRDEASS